MDNAVCYCALHMRPFASMNSPESLNVTTIETEFEQTIALQMAAKNFLQRCIALELPYLKIL